MVFNKGFLEGKWNREPCLRFGNSKVNEVIKLCKGKGIDILLAKVGFLPSPPCIPEGLKFSFPWKLTQSRRVSRINSVLSFSPILALLWISTANFDIPSFAGFVRCKVSEGFSCQVRLALFSKRELCWVFVNPRWNPRLFTRDSIIHGLDSVLMNGPLRRCPK